MPSRLRFHQSASLHPGGPTGLLELGDLVAFEGRHFGMTRRFVARITALDRPNSFVDEMVEGTFKWLRHVHEFESNDGLTIMRDRLEWKPPLGILGELADRVILRRHMRWFVATKQSALRQIAEKRATLQRA
jgi:ligand-binding SRPBCC domain-containing protein